MMHLIFAACMLLSAGLWDTATTWAGQTLDRVRANGAVRCGVSEGLPGFSSQRRSRSLSGL